MPPLGSFSADYQVLRSGRPGQPGGGPLQHRRCPQRVSAGTDRTRGGAYLSVGITGIGPCVVPCDVDLKPLRPAIMYGVDTRATDEIQEIRRTVGNHSEQLGKIYVAIEALLTEKEEQKSWGERERIGFK